MLVSTTSSVLPVATVFGRDGRATILQNKLVTRNSLGVWGSAGYFSPNNTVTSFVDLNPVYGSSDHTTKKQLALSAHKGGKLVVGVNNELPRNDPKDAFAENECNLFGPSDTSHMTGDARVDENFVLTAIHLLFVRQHNRIADQLAASHSEWDDEKLFQESRKRNIAIFQHLIYDEVLPRVYGSKATRKIIGNYNGNDPDIDPSATIEFSTAAFHLHSMVNLPALFLSGTCDMSYGVITNSTNPFVIQERTDCDPIDYRRIGHEDVICGALIQHAQEYDNHVTQTLMNIRIGAPGNVDVQAANIFRGRQHCLGTTLTNSAKLLEYPVCMMSKKERRVLMSLRKACARDREQERSKARDRVVSITAIREKSLNAAFIGSWPTRLSLCKCIPCTSMWTMLIHTLHWSERNTQMTTGRDTIRGGTSPGHSTLLLPWAKRPLLSP